MNKEDRIKNSGEKEGIPLKAWFKKLPLPVSGLMLGLAALGSLLGTYHTGTRSLLGILSGILLLLLVVKILLFPGDLKEDFGNPATASSLAAFPMTIMLLSTHVQPMMPAAAYIAWQLSIGLSVLLMVLYTKTFLLGFSLEKVLPSWFVLYMGILVASVTAPVYDMELLGQLVFWFGLLVYILLLPLVTYRVLKLREIPESARPTLVLYAAPAGLLLAGYLESFPVKDQAILFLLGIWASFMAIYGLVQMARLLVKLPFQPGFSAFTFPFVFSAIAFSTMVTYLSDEGSVSSWFGPVRAFTILGSTLLVLFVFFQYVWFMATHTGKAETPSEKEASMPGAEMAGSQDDSSLSRRKPADSGKDQQASREDLPVSEKANDSEKEEAV